MSTFHQWQAEEAEKAKVAEELRQGKGTNRIEAFSDAVFAISIALLVLEIKVPQPYHGPLLESLADLYPSFLGYAASFLTILVMWMNHHRLFKLLKRSDEWLPFANGVLLLVVAFIPFPTAVMAEYWKTGDQQVGVLFYAGTFVVLAIAFQVLWFCAAHKNRLVDRTLDHRRIDTITRQYMLGPFMYLFAFAVGFWQPVACLAMDLLFAVSLGLPGLSFAKGEPKEEAA